MKNTNSFHNLKRFARVELLVAALVAVVATGCATTHPPAAPTSKAQQQSITPAQALEKLEAGNARHVAGKPLHRDWPGQRSATAGGQYPYAVILSCMDSRASSEIIFDQGLGDIFNVRIAGNVVNQDILGSMEFGCQVAGAKLIAVIGHSRCGAVKGACTGAQLGNLTTLLEHFQPAVAEGKTRLPGAAADDPKLVEEVARLHVLNVMRQIRQDSPVLRELIDSGRVGIVGGIHDLDSGKVQFFRN